MIKKTKMVEATKTRIEKLIPDYSKLKFANKEEKSKEDELSGLDKKDVVVWRQLESQAHMANEQLEDASDKFQAWLDEYEEVQDMIVVQKALNVIQTFGRLLLALDSERQFVLAILSSYLREIKESKRPERVIEKEVEKNVIKHIKVKKYKLTRAALEADVIQKWQRGISTKELAKIHNIHLRTIQKIISEFRKMTRKKDETPISNESENKSDENQDSKEENEDYEDNFIKSQEVDENN